MPGWEKLSICEVFTNIICVIGWSSPCLNKLQTLSSAYYRERPMHCNLRLVRQRFAREVNTQVLGVNGTFP